jgi:hypothetical protein
MADCRLALTVHQANTTVSPGGELTGEVVVTVDAAVTCNGLTVCPEWRTSGTGNPAGGEGEKLVLFTGQWEAGEHRYRFGLRAPLGPFTYDGTLVDIRWNVKARADVPWALDPKAEVPFTLAAGKNAGDVPYYFGPNYQPPDPKTLGVALSEHGRAVTKSPTPKWAQVLVGLVLVMAAVGMTAAVPVLGVCLGPVVAFFLIRRAMVKSKLGDPEVRISPNPAIAGDAIRVLARVVPKKAVKLGKLTAELMGQERVVRGSGKHARTHFHKLHVAQVPFQFGAREVQGGEPIMLDATLQLPPGAPLTFAAPSNCVEWSVKLQLELLGWPDWDKTFPLTVRPKAALLPATTFG